MRAATAAFRAGVALIITLPVAAFAQDTAPVDAATVDADAGAADEMSGEILVTARKRSESARRA